MITFQLSKGINTFEAETKGKSLIVFIPQDNRKIGISIQGRLLTIEMTQQTKEESEHEKGKANFVSYGASSMTQILQQPINLEEATIEYENDRLLISIPKIMQPQGKKVPVTIKPAKEQKESITPEK